MAHRICPKLSSCYFGPSQFLSHVGEVAYKLKLPDTSRIHPVFHVSQLKRSLKDGSTVNSLPLGLEMTDSDFPVPEAVLATRENKRQGVPILEWLILWKSQPLEEATWESAVSIQEKFPSFCLEDKAASNKGGIDGKTKWDKPYKVYYGRPKTKGA